MKPREKRQIVVGDRGNLCEYGDVIEVGKDVTSVKVGDCIGYTVFGINKLEIDNDIHYFVPETDEFLLGTIMAEE